MKHFLRHRFFVYSTWALLSLLSSQVLLAAPPATINLQGTLQAAGGSPVSGTHPYQLRFYTSAVGGSLLQSSNGQLVASVAGRYSIALVPAPGVIAAGTVYYDLAVDANDNGLDPDDLFPQRVKVHSVPFALLSRDSAALGGNEASLYPTIPEMDAALGGKAPMSHDHSDYWKLAGNVVSPTQMLFLGTINDRPLELWTSGRPALRLIPGNVSPSLAGGHEGNFIPGGVQGAAIGGGGDPVVGINQVQADYGVVGGGRANRALGTASTVSGGEWNAAENQYTTVGGGINNRAAGLAATVAGGGQGGVPNVAAGDYSFVGGGWGNEANGPGTVAAGGFGNTTNMGFCNTIGGGIFNQITGTGNYVVIAGGAGNRSASNQITIAGGIENSAAGTASSIGGGYRNITDGTACTVAGGESNSALASHAFVGGGQNNVANWEWSTVGGGDHNTALNSGTVVGGGSYNRAEGLMSGVLSGFSNSATGQAAFIGGGMYNMAGGDFSVVGGGGGLDGFFPAPNVASGAWSVVGGGQSNRAEAHSSTIAGGFLNHALGKFSMVAGGELCVASGDYSFAAGRRAKALRKGSFVWADSTDTDFEDDDVENSDNTFNVRASGGMRFRTSTLGEAMFINDGTGIALLTAADFSEGGHDGSVVLINTGTKPSVYVRNYNGPAARFVGNVNIEGTLTKSSGSFKIDHPLDPTNKYLYHSFVESPDMKNIYDGNVVLDASGEATVQLPDWFDALNCDYRYQLTCIGGFAPVYVAEEIADNRFKIAGGKPGLKVSWQVTGIRQDDWANAHRIVAEEDKPPEERGKYLHPEVFGQPASMGLTLPPTDTPARVTLSDTTQGEHQ